MTSHDHIRKTVRTHRKTLSAEIVSSASIKVFQKIIQLPVFQKSEHIALYSAHENEIDPTLIAERARELKKHIYFPVSHHKHTVEFYLMDEKTSLKENSVGILEPIIHDKKPIAPEKLNLILVPIVAFDHHANRIGRGAGAYDRYLQFTKTLSVDHRPFLIGLAYEFQRVEKIIASEWDVKMDWIVTEDGIYL